MPGLNLTLTVSNMSWFYVFVHLITSQVVISIVISIDTEFENLGQNSRRYINFNFLSVSIEDS